jgi:hypothetical protein
MEPEHADAQEIVSNPSPEPEAAREDVPVPMTPGPADEFPTEPPPAPPPQAEPGVYLCLMDAGEHAVLGTLTEGEAYDYTTAAPHILQSVAAYVELGVLEKM